MYWWTKATLFKSLIHKIPTEHKIWVKVSSYEADFWSARCRPRVTHILQGSFIGCFMEKVPSCDFIALKSPRFTNIWIYLRSVRKIDWISEHREWSCDDLKYSSSVFFLYLEVFRIQILHKCNAGNKTFWSANSKERNLYLKQQKRKNPDSNENEKLKWKGKSTKKEINFEFRWSSII